MHQSAILLVDDEAVNRLLLRRMLEKEGYRCREAEDGQAALEAVAEELPELVLLDVMMPRLNGFEVCRRLRAELVTRAVPVVMVTTLNDRESRIAGLAAGADDFISKPVDQTELIARVRSLLRLRYFQSLAAQRELLEAAFRNLATGLLVTEPDGRIVAANTRARHLLNLQTEAVVGLELPAQLAGFTLEPPLARVLADRREVVVFDIRREGELPLVIEARLTRILDPDGAEVYHAIVLQDVTAERRESRFRSDFLALTAHKIRTPLTVLRGLVELLGDDRGQELAGDLLPEILPEVLAKLDEVTAISNTLLRDSARGQLPDRLEPVRCRLEELLPELLAEIGPERLTLVEDGGELPLSPVDARLILRELLQNAVKFGADTITLERRETADGIELLVGDDGQGIPHEHFETIFAECFQLDRDFTGQVPGLGLGLALVRRVVAAYRGTIEVCRSAPGQGTTFRLRLPRVAPG